MGKFIDLTGQTFGRLKVLGQAENTPTNNVQWRCECECGNVIVARSDYLRQGRIISCGCSKADFLKNRAEQKDLTGQKIGNLTVIKRTNRRYGKNGAVIYKCRCNCGNIVEILSTDLLRNHTKSCGCIKSKGEQKVAQLLRNASVPFEVQKTFDDCRNPQNNFHLKFDFFVNNQYVIEYDGIQHSVCMGWNSEKDLLHTQWLDGIKDEYCRNHNIPIIRIPYTKYDTLDINDLLLKGEENIEYSKSE